jgi:DNA-binding MarR family transcriptional regulator
MYIRWHFDQIQLENLTKTRQEALHLIDRAMVRIRRSQSRRTIGRLMQRELGLTLNLSDIFVADALDELAESGVQGPTVGTMAARLGIEPSRASRMVTSAIEAGLVKRLASQSDGRRSYLELTKTGRKALATVRQFRIAFFYRILSAWSDHDCAQFAAFLTRFTGSLKDAGGKLDLSVRSEKDH